MCATSNLQSLEQWILCVTMWMDVPAKHFSFLFIPLPIPYIKLFKDKGNRNHGSHTNFRKLPGGSPLFFSFNLEHCTVVVDTPKRKTIRQVKTSPTMCLAFEPKLLFTLECRRVSLSTKINSPFPAFVGKV